MPSRSSSQQHASFLPWLFWGVAAVFYGYQFILRVAPTVIVQELSAHFAVEAGALGVLVSSYYIGYTALQVPGGLLLDRFGPRRPLALACLLCAVGSLVFATAVSIPWLWVGRLLMGVGSAFGFLSCMKLASLWFPAAKLSMLVGWTMVLGTTGAVGAGAPLAMLVARCGWQAVILGLATAGACWAVVILCTVRDGGRPAAGEVGSQTQPAPVGVWVALWAVLGLRKTWWLGLYGLLTYVPLAGFADLWGTPFMMHVYGVDKTTAATVALIFYVGMGLSAPCVGLVASWLKSNLKVMRHGALGTLLCFLVLCLVPMPFWATYPLIFAAGSFAAVQFLAFVLVNGLHPQACAATATGVHNMLCMLSGVIFQPLIGWLLDWAAPVVAGQVLHTPLAYQTALLVVPVAMGLAWGLTFCLGNE